MKRNCALIVAACLAVGCGGDGGDEWTEKRPATVPAGGTITFNGEPLEGATIVLSPTTPGPDAYGASGVSDSDGSFSLSTFPPDEGAVPGSYSVSVSKIEAAPQAEPSEGSHDEKPAPPPKQLLPAKYADANKSGLKAEIPKEGTSELKFDLKK